jgi:hypothetical protein
MTRLRQFAVAAVCGTFLTVGLIGCTHDRPDSVGANATLAASGNHVLTYMAPQSGVVTVQDARSDDVVYSGRINKGESVVVDTEHDDITIGGRIVTQKHLDSLHEHRVFFEPTGMTQSTATETTTHTETQHTEGTTSGSPTMSP